jgi:hypothetical protein
MALQAIQQQQAMQVAIARQQQIAAQKQAATLQNSVANDTWDVLRQFGARGALGNQTSAVPATTAPAPAAGASGGASFFGGLQIPGFGALTGAR